MGTVVVQVGDLIGRSTESEDLIRAVDGIRRNTPDRWVQLAGNHEIHHLGGHQFQGTCELSDPAVETMRGWLHEGWLRFATAVEHGSGATLVTHAGLTRALWSELGSPTAAADAAAVIDELRATAEGWEVLNRPGRMLNLGRFPMNASDAFPIWAEASFELLPDWVSHGDMPFDQVHGHSSLFDWFRGRLRNPDLSNFTSVDHESRHVVATVGGARMITGIDPGLGRDGHDRWSPLAL